MRKTLILLILFSCSSPTSTSNSIGVEALDFTRPTNEAIKIINSFVGCKVLVAGSDVIVKSSDGNTCGHAFHDSIESDHSAMAYRCGSRFEIHVERPGNIHTRLCIIAHELGHVLGLEDGMGGIMDQRECPEYIRLSYRETKQLRKLCR